MSYLATTPLLRSWEKHFTVVQWDRRGTGKTFGRNGKAGSQPMTFDQMVDDGIEVAEHLRRRLDQDKVVVPPETKRSSPGWRTSAPIRCAGAEVQAPAQGLTLIPDAGHLAAFHQPEAFLAALLDRVRPLAATPGTT